MGIGLPRILLILVLLTCACARASAEVVIIGPGLIMPVQRKPPEFPNGLQPGRAQAKEAPPAGAVRFSWDTYTSTVIVGDGTGTARPAWVLTYDQTGQFVVGYRARAFKAADGLLHIDARSAIDNGPMAEQWIPDSFAIGADDTVFTLDDQGHGNEGKVLERIAPQTPDFDALMQLAETLISGSI